MTFAALATYVPAAGLVALALYHLSIGDLPGAATAVASAFGVVGAAHLGPTAATPPAN